MGSHSKTELELQQFKARLDAICDGILMFGAQALNIVLVFPGMLGISGYTESELLAMQAFDPNPDIHEGEPGG